jgi:hypothetical protein
MGYYSREVLATLVLMSYIAGAGRTLAVKVYFFSLALTISRLYAVLWHSLAVPIYWLVEWLVPAAGCRCRAF